MGRWRLQALHKIEVTWGDLKLSFSPYQNSAINQLTVDDFLIESLESDNMALQNLYTSKYVQVAFMLSVIDELL